MRKLIKAVKLVGVGLVGTWIMSLGMGVVALGFILYPVLLDFFAPEITDAIWDNRMFEAWCYGLVPLWALLSLLAIAVFIMFKGVLYLKYH